jgi:hypothetical protein
MYKLVRFALIAGTAAALQAAYAQANFTVVNAYYTLNSSGPFAFNVSPNTPAMTIDFIPTAPAFKVGDSTGFSSGVGTIIYTVTSAVPIFGIDMVIQGNVQQWGQIHWTETAESGNTNLGSISGMWRGSSYAGGVDGAFTQTAHLDFSMGVTQFKVKKTFDIDIAGQTLPSDSIATVSLIEQNLTPVPEPASIVAMGLGAAALLRRRRRK